MLKGILTKNCCLLTISIILGLLLFVFLPEVEVIPQERRTYVEEGVTYIFSQGRPDPTGFENYLEKKKSSGMAIIIIIFPVIYGPLLDCLAT